MLSRTGRITRYAAFITGAAFCATAFMNCGQPGSLATSQGTSESFGSLKHDLGSANSLSPLIAGDAPLISQQEELLNHVALLALTNYDWSSSAPGSGPNVGFPFLHPGSSTGDQRVKTENCESVGISNLTIPGKKGDTGVCLFTSNPESIAGPIAGSVTSPISKPFPINAADFYISPVKPPADYSSKFSRGQRFICDVNNLNFEANKLTGQNSNPFPCSDAGDGSSPTSDCYDITHMGTLNETSSAGQTSRITGRRIRVVVSNPKTSKAFVSKIIYLEAAKNGPTFDSGTNNLFTPQVSGDGKLLIVGSTHGILYSYSKTPCNAGGWTTFKPITTMYLDPDVNTKYGIARFPIRDSENNVLAPVFDAQGALISSGIEGLYLWMDSNANLLFFNAAIGNHPYFIDNNTGLVVERYPVKKFSNIVTGERLAGADLLACNTQKLTTPAVCFTKLMAPFAVAGDPDQMAAFFGLWTNGKVVVPDAINQNTFGLGGNNTIQTATSDLRLSKVTVETDLYGDAANTWTVADNHIRRKNGFANAYNHLPNMRPNASEDVVWFFSTDNSMDEIAFDDFMRLDSFIASPMNASITQRCVLNHLCFGQINDGTLNADPLNWKAQAPSTLHPRLQNTASSAPPGIARAAGHGAFSRWNVPPFGQLMGGARIEPVAAGGVRGSGLYLTNKTWVQYSIPANNPSNEMATDSWFYSLWVDPRGSGPQTLFGLSNGSYVSLDQDSVLSIHSVGGGQSVRLELPSGLAVRNRQWTHLAIAVKPGADQTEIGIYINGFHLADVSVHGSALVPAPGGQIYLGSLGAAAGGFMGWVDDFKVSSRIPNVEEICHQAYGTLVGLNSPADGLAWAYAENFPAASHSEITQLLPPSAKKFPAYFCETSVSMTAITSTKLANSYCVGNFRNPSQQPDPSRCIGNSLTFPEGPIRPGAPRPNSVNNQFCLSCHVSSHPSETLQPVALTPSNFAKVIGATSDMAIPNGDLLSEFDPKRRPTEPPSTIYGVIPAGYFCPNVPPVLRTSRLMIDRKLSLCSP